MSAKCGHPIRARHWFTIPGLVGIPTRKCVYCSAPNPNLARRLEALGWTEADLEGFEREIGITS